MTIELRPLRDGALVGSIASFTMDEERELSYWIAREHWGRGIATEALRRFLAVELERPIFARTAAHNVASAAVLRRNGFAHVGSERSWAPGVGAEVVEHIHRLG